MSRRTNKRIYIGLIFFLILAGLVFLVYYFNQPAPSCSDGIQNQGEKGIDCGGPCPPCELVYIKDIEVLWAEAVASQDNFYDLAARIKNPNPNYGSGQVPYQFEVYDSQGNLTNRLTGSTFVLPNQTKYLLQTKTEVKQPVGQIKLSFGQIDWRKIEDYQPPELFVQQKEYHLLPSEELGFSQVKGILLNRTNFGFEKIDIDILLFDAGNQLLAVNQTEVRTLAAGQRRDFTVSWFREINGQVNFVEAEAETNVFDSANFLSPETKEPEEFQQY